MPSGICVTTPAAHLSPGSPYGWCFCAADLQEVVPILQLEVGEDQCNGVPRLGKDSPGAVSIVLVLRGEVWTGYGAAGPPQGASTGTFGCRDIRGYSVVSKGACRV